MTDSSQDQAARRLPGRADRPSPAGSSGTSAGTGAPDPPPPAGAPPRPPDCGELPSARFAFRRNPPTERERTDLRPPYAIDCDRILYSRAYSRYIDKTQVFWLLKNDHITHRVLPVQLVSRIARTIGQKLGLDPDFLEAASLGHDLGHPPFGHDGEKFLSELCREAGIGGFVHAVMSVRFLEGLENRGRGLNLTLGVLDAVLCHDGESDFASLKPRPGTADFAELDRRAAARLLDPVREIPPMTREGCVVRLSDVISYVGRDLEDAVLMGVVDRRDVPRHVARTLGETCGTIVYRLVDDLLRTSRDDPGLTAFSPEVGAALKTLKDFNRSSIYYNPRVKRDRDKIKTLFRIFFESFTGEFEAPGGPRSKMLKSYLEHMDGRYREETLPAEMARDFIAGMTDEYFCSAAQELLIPAYSSDVGKTADPVPPPLAHEIPLPGMGFRHGPPAPPADRPADPPPPEAEPPGPGPGPEEPRRGAQAVPAVPARCAGPMV
ncbi:MAG: HD domain-containing protein, partial [Deltaproteobacteria bacterium]|nr:HD domain-containing protein [Deltaproteobacteria bacterium]